MGSWTDPHGHACSTPKSSNAKGTDTSACLTSAQVETARAIYGPVHQSANQRGDCNPVSNAGSENGWATMGRSATVRAPVHDLLQILWCFKDPNWDYKTFNFDSDVVRTMKAENGS